MNLFGNDQIKTCRKIRRYSASPGGKQVGADDPHPVRSTHPVERIRDRFGSKAREQQVPSAVWKHILFPKHLAIQIWGTKQIQTGNESIQGEKTVSWGRQWFWHCCREVSGSLPEEEQFKWQYLSLWRWHRLKDHSTPPPVERLRLAHHNHSPPHRISHYTAYSPDSEAATRFFFYLLLFSMFVYVQTSKYKPVFKRQLHDCHRWCKTIHLFLLTVSPFLSFFCIWIYIDRGSLFLPQPLCWELNTELFIQRKLAEICYFRCKGLLWQTIQHWIVLNRAR